MKMWLPILTSLILLSGCSLFAPSTPKAYRFKLGDGSVVQCKTMSSYECGVSLRECLNNHEYYCIHALDVEVTDANAPIQVPVPVQPQQQQQSAQPTPAPHK